MGIEERNLAAVDKWAELYNNEGAGFVEKCYVPDVVVECPGTLEIHGVEAFTVAEQAVCDVAPRRRVQIDRKVAENDVVVVQATLLDSDRGADYRSRFCAVLTFNDQGLIVNDTTYFDAASWPMPADIVDRLSGMDVQWEKA